MGGYDKMTIANYGATVGKSDDVQTPNHTLGYDKKGTKLCFFFFLTRLWTQPKYESTNKGPAPVYGIILDFWAQNIALVR